MTESARTRNAEAVSVESASSVGAHSSSSSGSGGDADARSSGDRTELDKLVAEYKHIADNDGEHRIADLVWLVNELIYEREHRQ